MNTSPYYRHHNLLFSPDLLQRVQIRTQPYCTDEDFPVKKGLSVRDEAQRAYRIARSAWQSFCAAASGPEAQQRFLCTIFCEVLGYDAPFICPESGIPPEFCGDTPFVPADTAAEDDSAPQSLFPVSMMLSCGKECFSLPVLVVPQSVGLDDRFSFSTGQRMTPTQMLQTFLNASQEYLWGIVTNGANWRLLRDNPFLSRLCYLDIDLEQIMQDDAIAAFDGIFWRMLHFSRADRQQDRGADSCLWEQWHRDLEEHGARVGEGLRDGVEEAICCLGTGFLHGTGEGNDCLRTKLADGELNVQDYYNQLMRLVYRIIFLSALEERELLHEHRGADKQAAEIYAKGYSLSRLTHLAMFAEQEDSRHDDLWQAQLIVFRALGQDTGSPELALPALGGIFSPEQCPDIDACRLSNSAFLAALHFLRWTSTDSKRTLIDYVNMDAEELGSGYEGLLELTPRVDNSQNSLYFVGGSADPSAPNRRKIPGHLYRGTGSYHTPSCLVEQVLRCSLDPLLDECCKDAADTQRRILDLRIIDPACGSGHFLLLAARRLADRLAKARTSEQNSYTPQVFCQAMRDVIRQCIYGVDMNPMAIEFVRVNFWLESYQPGKALLFLDDHLRCGNPLLGVFDTKSLYWSIPEVAFTCDPGDDKDVCAVLKKVNQAQIRNRRDAEGSPRERKFTEYSHYSFGDKLPSQVQQQARNWRKRRENMMASRAAIAADIWIGAFILPKMSRELVPTTATLDNFLADNLSADDASIRAARQACKNARIFHWFLEFPEIFERGGFDCVLGNPPIDRIEVYAKEWFAKEYLPIAACAKTDTRLRMIEDLRNGNLPDIPPERQRDIFARYENDLRMAAVSRTLVHVSESDGGRFPLTGTGFTNMSSLFAELSCQLRKEECGRVGIIVPTNFATDKATAGFFNYLVKNQQLHALYDFENRSLNFFTATHEKFRFSIVSIATSPIVDVACGMTNTRELEEKERHAFLKAEDFVRFNPNTGTCPLFRCSADADISVKISRNVPILWNERTGENPWGAMVAFAGTLHLSSDSHLFLTSVSPDDDVLPLYEAKLIHHYDHRFKIFGSVGANAKFHEPTLTEKRNPNFEMSPRYWVRREDVLASMPKNCKSEPKWLIASRDNARAIGKRTCVMSFIPFSGVGDSMRLVSTEQPIELEACFVANASSLVFDYLIRQKIGGQHLDFLYLKQTPFLPPSAYSEEDVAYIKQRVLELVYTSYSMKPLAETLGYNGEPFVWDEDRRAQLTAELDAYYAKRYNLTREELAYILDPTTRYPKNCPTETFRTLLKDEMRAYGEYRTKRLVLAAYDELTRQGK